jgi:hypothetical protein
VGGANARIVLFVSNEGHELVANVYGSIRHGTTMHTGVWAYGTKNSRRWTYVSTWIPSVATG